ncbi:hypothetical protein N7510_002378 [Penicillium lagena]|uniref:uncharacterized protein n=1 Tax=Penicillium lagena TaxID=94218 RepID=UPI0025406E0E|nr:uncharacterized protein N7510_002378 [Penicillium lagena]KAJ5626069.1 hypothetical protein N7510_002378 [Penicillium lagena]
MSDFFRRASDALHHRKDSTDSTDAPKTLDAKEPLEHGQSEPAQPEAHVNETFTDTAADDKTRPKQRRHWVWGHHEGNKPETKQQPSQPEAQKDNTDWVVGS